MPLVLSTISTQGNVAVQDTKTFDDVLEHVLHQAPLQEVTRKDYASSVRRLPRVINVNRLTDIPADFEDVKARLYRLRYEPDLFKSASAFKAWRRKVIAALKQYLGMIDAERAQRNEIDGWTRLEAEASALIADGGLNVHVNALLPLKLLMKLGRSDDREPWRIDDTFIEACSRKLGSRERSKLHRSVALLARLQIEAPSLQSLLPTHALSDQLILEKFSQPAVRADLMDECEGWLLRHKSGSIDPIENASTDGVSTNTITGYRSAFKSYLRNAETLGLLDDVNSLADALQDRLARQVMREMLHGATNSTSLSPRTALQYLENIARLAKLEDIETAAIVDALKRNTTLKKGRIARRTMSPDAVRFCKTLLHNRDVELRFRSMHVRLYNRALVLMQERSAGRFMKQNGQQVIQVGSLAAMSAIWLWGTPLRISNMKKLRLHGEAPQLLMPHTKKGDALIRIEAKDTKNKKDIKQDIKPGRSQAIKVLEWYISEVRPLIPGADRSKFLFPSSKNSTKSISDTAIRNWMANHILDQGIQMNPHNFRHGIASLYLRSFPGAYDHVAYLLDDGPETIRQNYAWIDKEAIMKQVQKNILEMAGF